LVKKISVTAKYFRMVFAMSERSVAAQPAMARKTDAQLQQDVERGAELTEQ
jgi:hypothetical protein